MGEVPVRAEGALAEVAPTVSHSTSRRFAAIHPAPLVRPFGLKGKRFYWQAKRLLYAKLGGPMQDLHLQGPA